MNKNKKFPYFPKLKRKKDYKIISLFILLLFFSIIFLTQNKKQIKTEVKAQKVLGTSTVKKIKKIITPTLKSKIINSFVFPINIPPTSTPTTNQNQSDLTATSTPIPSTPPTPSILPTPSPTQTPTIPTTTPTPSSAATPTPIPIEEIIIRPTIHPKITIFPIPTCIPGGDCPQ